MRDFYFRGGRMKNNFLVVDGKKILITMVSITLISIFSIFGTNIAHNVIETTTNERLIPIYSVETIDKWVALTFDCAWGADDIESIIDTLNADDVKATFFTVGSWVEKNPDAVKKLFDAGMEIGNHSDNHAHVNKLSYSENKLDMEKCNKKIEDITGEKVKFYRGPYGEYNNTVIRVADTLGMQVIQWDVDTL